MTHYKGPESIPEDNYQGRFVRAGEEIVFGPSLNSEAPKSHAEIARDDGLLLVFLVLREENPDEVDAGFLMFARERRSMVARNFSQGLKAPIREQARIRTGEVLGALSPGYDVEIDASSLYSPLERR